MKSITVFSLVLGLLALFSIMDVSAGPVKNSTPQTTEPKSLTDAEKLKDLQELKAARANIEAQIKRIEQQLREMAETMEAIDRSIEILESGKVLKDAKLRFDGFYDRSRFVRTGKDYALLLATNDYIHWNNLKSSIADAEDIGAELKDRYGFSVDIRRNLKTRTDILQVIAAYAEKDYGTGDQLFVYFTGHGYFNEMLKDGYIAAGESKSPKDDPGMGSYLAYAELKQHLDRIPCDRIMLTLDVDYGGTFDDGIALTPGALKPEGPPTRGLQVRLLRLQNTLKVRTRWYLSSGGQEPVFDGIERNSPFALALLQTLRMDLDDGVLTIPEIEKQLPSKLQVELDKFEAAWKKEQPLWDGEMQQTPASGPFGSGKAADKAFVFIEKDFVPTFISSPVTR